MLKIPATAAIMPNTIKKMAITKSLQRGAAAISSLTSGCVGTNSNCALVVFLCKLLQPCEAIFSQMGSRSGYHHHGFPSFSVRMTICASPATGSSGTAFRASLSSMPVSRPDLDGVQANLVKAINSSPYIPKYAIPNREIYLDIQAKTGSDDLKLTRCNVSN